MLALVVAKALQAALRALCSMSLWVLSVEWYRHSQGHPTSQDALRGSDYRQCGEHSARIHSVYLFRIRHSRVRHDVSSASARVTSWSSWTVFRFDAMIKARTGDSVGERWWWWCTVELLINQMPSKTKAMYSTQRCSRRANSNDAFAESVA